MGETWYDEPADIAYFDRFLLPDPDFVMEEDACDLGPEEDY